MIYQYSNLAMSSFLLWLQNRVLTLGQAYYNVGTQLYPMTNQIFAGYSVYSCPFNQVVSDSSIPGAQLMTGLYLNNTFINIGQSGWVDFNFEKGEAYFSSPLPAGTIVSGNYAINEINIAMPSFPDIKLLFESKYSLRNKQPTVPTGLNYNIFTYPAVFVGDAGGSNSPFAMGGLDQTRTEVDAYIMCQSKFELDALNGIFKDSQYKWVPLIDINEMPFNNLGGYKSGNVYNYTNLVGNRVQRGSGILIEKVDIVDWTRKEGINRVLEGVTTDNFFSYATFTLWRDRVTN